MSTARSAIEDRIELLANQQKATTGTASGGTLTTVVDSSRPSSGERFTEWWIHIDTDAGGASAAPEGEERVVSSYDASTGTFTVPIAFTASPANLDTYSVRRNFSKTLIDEMINAAIDEAQQLFVDVQTDETTRIKTDINEYSLPTGCKHVYQIWMRVSNDDDSGTASGGSSTTLEDTSKSWTVNEHANKEAVVYDGTGTGEWGTVSSNTSDTLTISGDNYSTGTDSTSKYKIKDFTTDDPEWERVTQARIDIAGGEVRFPDQLTAGEALRIIYHKEYAALTSDAATTDMPATFIAYKASALLWASLAGRRDRAEDAKFLLSYYESQADKFVAQHPRILPSDTMWIWPGRPSGWLSGPLAPSGQSAGES